MKLLERILSLLAVVCTVLIISTKSVYAAIGLLVIALMRIAVLVLKRKRG